MVRRPSKTVLAHLLLLVTVFVWGATFSLVKSALSDISPLLFNLLRMTLAAIALALVNFRCLRELTGRQLAYTTVVGLLLAAGYQFQTAGLARTTPTKSAFLTGLVVVFVPLLTTIPRLRPPGTPAPHWSTGLGALSAFAGLTLLTTPAGTPFLGLLRSVSTGDLLTLICAIAFAGHLLALGHFSQSVPTAQLATLQIAFAAVFMLLTLPFSGSLYVHLTPRVGVALAITSILGTAAAFTVQSWAQQHMQASHTAILLTLEPVFALSVSFIFFDERFSHRSVGGIALILAGIGVIEFTSPSRTVV